MKNTLKKCTFIFLKIRFTQMTSQDQLKGWIEAPVNKGEEFCRNARGMFMDRFSSHC